MITRIIGLGNLLAGDDGVGVHVVGELARRKLPPGVQVIDGGNCGLGLLSLLEGAQQVIIIDAILCAKAPGSVLQLDGRRFALQEQEAPCSHRLSLAQTLRLADILGYGCRVRIIGISPGPARLGTQLSPGVRAALPRVVEMVCEQVKGFGYGG